MLGQFTWEGSSKMSYGISAFGEEEYAAELITGDGDISDLQPHANVEEFCVITCSGSNV